MIQIVDFTCWIDTAPNQHFEKSNISLEAFLRFFSSFETFEGVAITCVKFLVSLIKVYEISKLVKVFERI